MPGYTRESGNTLDVVGVCVNRIGMDLCSYYAAAGTLWRRRLNPARPYMVRLMTFSRLICPSGAPGQRQGGMHGIAILTKAASEALEAPGLSGRDPAVELVGQALLDHGRERPGQVDRPGDRRRQLKQHEPAVVLAQLSGSLISRRAALRGVGGLGGLAGAARSAAGS